MLVVRDAGAKLIDIPGLLLHLLEYTMEEEFETDLWEWLAQIRRVCRAFRDLTPELVPVKFSPSRVEMNTRGALVCSLTRSFPAAPWKTAKLVYISNWSWWSEIEASFFEALRRLLETPESLPKLEELQLRAVHVGTVIDAGFLCAMARNLPRLSRLRLKRDSFTSGLLDRVTPNEFGTFAQLLQRPLQALTLQCCRMTDAHLNAFFSHHNGSSLTELDIGWNRSLSNLALNTISRHCSNLVRLSLNGCLITSSGLEVILQANRGICHLDVNCLGVICQCIDDIPSLDTLTVFANGNRPSRVYDRHHPFQGHENQVLETISAVLDRNSRLRKLSLFVDDSFRGVPSIPSFGDDRVSDEGCRAFEHALTNNTSLRVLNLGGIYLGNVFGASLKRALDRNSTLEEFGVDDYCVPMEFAGPLYEALATRNSQTTLSDATLIAKSFEPTGGLLHANATLQKLSLFLATKWGMSRIFADLGDDNVALKELYLKPCQAGLSPPPQQIYDALGSVLKTNTSLRSICVADSISRVQINADTIVKGLRHNTSVTKFEIDFPNDAGPVYFPNTTQRHAIRFYTERNAWLVPLCQCPANDFAQSLWPLAISKAMPPTSGVGTDNEHTEPPSALFYLIRSKCDILVPRNATVVQVED